MGCMLVVSSEWTNVINAIIFEVVLITFIFYLTADVCGRLNYLSLVDGSVQDLEVVSPPLVGGGVISTSRKLSMLMIGLRGLGIFLIFGTALTIDGETRDEKVRIMKPVRIPADVPSNATGDQILKFVELRSTCAFTKNNCLVFGRLDDDMYCETSMPLLEGTIQITINSTQTAISFSSGCDHSNLLVATDYRGGNLTWYITTCKQGIRKASVLCFRSISIKGEIQNNYCEGIFQVSESKWAVCENFDEKFSGMKISANLLCHEAKNLGQVQDRWIAAANAFGANPVIKLIRAVSVIGVENREVQKFIPRDVTNIHSIWFLCFAVKLVLLVILGLFSIRLRMKGAKRVLNDDRALLALLRHRLDDWFGARSEDQEQAIYLHLQTANDGQRKVWASTLPNYNPGNLNPEEET